MAVVSLQGALRNPLWPRLCLQRGRSRKGVPGPASRAQQVSRRAVPGVLQNDGGSATCTHRRPSAAPGQAYGMLEVPADRGSSAPVLVLSREAVGLCPSLPNPPSVTHGSKRGQTRGPALISLSWEVWGKLVMAAAPSPPLPLPLSAPEDQSPVIPGSAGPLSGADSDQVHAALLRLPPGPVPLPAQRRSVVGGPVSAEASGPQPPARSRSHAAASPSARSSAPAAPARAPRGAWSGSRRSPGPATVGSPSGGARRRRAASLVPVAPALPPSSGSPCGARVASGLREPAGPARADPRPRTDPGRVAPLDGAAGPGGAGPRLGLGIGGAERCRGRAGRRERVPVPVHGRPGPARGCPATGSSRRRLGAE